MEDQIAINLRLCFQEDDLYAQNAFEKLILEADDLTIRIVSLALLFSPNIVMRSDAVEVLGEVGTTADLDGLIQVSKDKEWSLRCSAAYSLSEIRHQKSLIRLMEMARDRQADVRRYAIEGLNKFVDDRSEVVDYLILRLQEERSKIVKLAIYNSLIVCGQSRFADDFFAFYDQLDPHIKNERSQLLESMIEEVKSKLG